MLSKMNLKKKIDEIADVLTLEAILDLGLLSGIGSQILTCSEFFIHQKISQNWLDYLHHILEEKLVGEFFLATHCSGISGIGWLYEYLSYKKMIDFDTNILLEDFDGYLEIALRKFMMQGNYDFLHGGVGIALYFIKRSAKNRKLVSVLNQFLDDLEKISILQEDGTIKWNSFFGYPNITEGYNISLSHGMSSIISILSKMHSVEGIDKEKTEILLRGVVKYILAQEIDKDMYGSYFPNCALESTPSVVKSRLAWCYGDLGISSVLYQAGKTLKEDRLLEKSIEVLLFAATQRRSLEDNFVSDAGLCHGTAGIGHIFYRMWWNTKLPQFKDATDYWFEQTLKMAKFEDGLAGFKALEIDNEKPVWKNKYGLLEGITGIGLALFTYYYEIDPAWDESLLLS